MPDLSFERSSKLGISKVQPLHRATEASFARWRCFLGPGNDVSLMGNMFFTYSWAKMNGADVSYTAVAVGDSPLGPFPRQ